MSGPRPRGGPEAPVVIDGELSAPRLDGAAASAALAEGLASGGAQAQTASPRLEAAEVPLQEARALVVLAPRLERAARPGTRFFELATRARQGGVPAFALVADIDGEPFTARILDLQRVYRVRTAAEAREAGARIAALL